MSTSLNKLPNELLSQIVGLVVVDEPNPRISLVETMVHSCPHILRMPLSKTQRTVRAISKRLRAIFDDRTYRTATITIHFSTNELAQAIAAWEILRPSMIRSLQLVITVRPVCSNAHLKYCISPAVAMGLQRFSKLEEAQVAFKLWPGPKDGVDEEFHAARETSQATRDTLHFDFCRALRIVSTLNKVEVVVMSMCDRSDTLRTYANRVIIKIANDSWKMMSYELHPLEGQVKKMAERFGMRYED